MEVKFAKLLSENGVAVEQTTAKIKDLIDSFNMAWEEYEVQVEEYENADDDKKELLQEGIEEFENDLSESDEIIYKKSKMKKITSKVILADYIYFRNY